MRQTEQQSQSLDTQSTEQQSQSAEEKQLTLEELASSTGGFALSPSLPRPQQWVKVQDSNGHTGDAG